MKTPVALATLLAAAVLAFSPAVAAQTGDKPVDAGPYVPSPDTAVSAMLREAGVGPSDFVIDLGSGDGKIVRTAALVFGARGFGVEIQDHLVKLSNESAKKEGIADRVKFMKQDLFKTDISQATVLTMYLLPNTVNMLKDKLLSELKPGTRVVSHDYALAGWRPHKRLEMDLQEKVAISGVTLTIIFVYVVPANVAGSWSATIPANVGKGAMRLDLTQQVTSVSGSARLDGKAVPLEDVTLVGEDLKFKLAGRKIEFTGKVKGKSIEGLVEAGGVKSPWSAALGG